MDMATDTDMDMEMANNYPCSAIWNASEIARRYFQWRYILLAPLQYGKKSYCCWNSFPNDVLAELEISI
jgi:hypothetical protein